MKRASLVRSFSWVLLGRVIAAVLQAALLALVARDTAPSDFGRIAAVLGAAMAGAAFFDLGLTTFVVRERSVDTSSGVVTRAVMLSRRQAVVMTAVFALALGGLGASVDRSYLYLLPLAVWISCERQADILTSLKFADGEPHYATVNLIVRRLVAVVLYVALSFVLEPASLSYTLAVMAAAVASLLGASWALRHAMAPPSELSYVDVMKRARYYWLNTAATQARNLDGALVALVGGAYVAGAYGVASRLTTPLRMIPTSMASATMPSASRVFRDRGDLKPVLKALGVTIGFCFIFALVAGVAVSWLLPAVLGSRYEHAVVPTQLVIASLPFAAAASLSGALLQAAGRPRVVAAVTTSTTALCLCAVPVGTVMWNATGAASALAMSFVVQSIVLALAARRAVKSHRRALGE